MASEWPPGFTMQKMTPAECGQFLRRIAEATNAHSQNWDNFEAICTQIVTDAYKGGHSAGQRAWQPIETAPKDGTAVWVHNGKHYGVAHWLVTPPESATWLKWDGADFVETPNPTVGQRLAFWSVDWATSDDTDHDGQYWGPEPKYWMPLPTPPEEA